MTNAFTVRTTKLGFRTLALVLPAIVSVWAALPAEAADDAKPVPIQTGTGHRFACTDYSGNKVFIVGADGKVEWEYTTGTCDDLWVLPNGNLLFNTGHGVLEVDRNKKIIFSYESPSEVYACQRLANGNTFVGECTAARLIEVEPSGKIAFELPIPPPDPKYAGHAYIRNARKLANGNYLVCFYSQEVVRELDPKGNVVAEIPAIGGPHSAARLPNGNTIVACGDLKKEAMVLEADKAGKTLWKITHDELPGISLKFMTGFQRLPNGNTVMSNWVGHGEFGKAPGIIEVTPDKKVVWTFQDDVTMKTVSSVLVLDVPGDPIKGDIIH
jgi:hypothetical protein